MKTIKVNSFSHAYGIPFNFPHRTHRHRSRKSLLEDGGRSAISLYLDPVLAVARSFWTWRDVSSAEVHGLHESGVAGSAPVSIRDASQHAAARKEEPDDADKALTTSLIQSSTPSSDIEKRKSAVTNKVVKVFAL